VSKPRWKSLVELVVAIAGVLIGATVVTNNLTWPPAFPQWFLVLIGVNATIVFLGMVERNWKEL
jgi:hypothetical protein